ncbi:MAG: hypothetical protein WCE94_05775 [Candidatus Methanoperedens sp.]
MAGIIDDTGGQWIALSGLTISISLVLVGILVNQAAITGYYSSYAELEFPKEKIRQITTQTQGTARSAAQLAWELDNRSTRTNGSVLKNFTAILSNYSAQMNTIYAVHGETVNITLFSYINGTTEDTFYYSPAPENISLFNSSNHIDNLWLNISYDDGTTSYASEPEIIEVKQ